ncbi:NTPase KAP [Rhizobium leguminosarum]|uniref:KAP family P-loop NTPase fold protein n=1 Tax=Rhizobium leguminosarum TaxID=384 RepID=UPI00027D911E|nr:P-loop NTPase fold protein [Rhizobium leguminosarum]RWY88578.1 NTPase KAP [Rhizobium leguminosarum]TAY16782.1 NTPase KAP [Rhizobium leguminosarum]
MSEPTFHGDRPIQSENEDRFGFAALANRVSESLTTQAANKGFVFGLEGKWGSGKSSLLALTLLRLRDMDPAKVAAVEFRPWLIGDRDQLLSALFEDLAKAIAGLQHAAGDATGVTKLAAKDVAEQVKSFARHLGPVGKLAGLLGVVIPGASIAGELLDKIGAAAAEQADGPTLVAQKEKLAKALLDLNCRIVVAIDDVDRLEPKEVAELLRLVRSVADFPNVSYLLCYDATALSRAIETGTGVASGTAYLEKIIQTEVAVPRPESFALRRWFSSELQLFAECGEERVPYLLQVIDETGGRVLENPRAVVRILDSLRVYWPSLMGRADLADLVWLRMIAVGSPNFYRWAEEYLVTFVALAGGRVHVSSEEREAMAKQMDEAMKLDGLDWEKHQFELERHLPGIQYQTFNKDKDERLFSRAKQASHAQDAKDKRLASPSHARLYFTLIDPPDGVTDLDIADLLAVARDGVNAVAFLLINMGEQKGDAGATKAERLLDQLRYMEQDVLLSWPVEILIMGLSNAADELARDASGDDWGYPRIWYLAKELLLRLKMALPEERFDAALKGVFQASTSLGFLTYLLRDETFGHGFFGNRPDPNERLTSQDGFDVIRATMLNRYSAGGLDKVMEERRATSMLYAWSQAGGRDHLIELVVARASDEVWLLKFIQKLYGPRSTLSLEGLASFFKSPVSIIRRVYALLETDPENQAAKNIIRSIKSNIHLNNGDFEAVLVEWEARESGGEDEDSAAGPPEGPKVA